MDRRTGETDRGTGETPQETAETDRGTGETDQGTAGTDPQPPDLPPAGTGLDHDREQYWTLFGPNCS